MNKTKFQTGQTVITRNAKTILNCKDVIEGLRRHISGDFGIVSEEDKAINEEALETGGMIMSAYKDRNGVKFWVITEHDRSATTVLLPSEY